MPKKALVLLVIAILIAAGFIGYNFLRNEEDNVETETKSGLIEETDKKVSIQEKIKQENRIILAGKALTEASNSEERYNALLEKGDGHYQLGRLKLARESIEEAVSIHPDRARTLSLLFDIQHEMGDLPAASETIEKLVKGNSSSSYWIKYIDYETNVLKSQPDRLQELHARALRETEQHISIIERFAKFMESQNNLQIAKEFWQQAVTKNPEDKIKYEAEIKRIDDLIKTQTQL